VIRIVRVLGAAIAAIVGLALGVADRGLFSGTSIGGVFLAVWLVAWSVLGFALLPYLTVVPAAWLVRQVQQLSTAEFVTAVGGLLMGLLMGLLVGLPLSALPHPYGTWLPIAVSFLLALGMVGLTVAKREDLIVALEGIGLFRRGGQDAVAAASAAQPQIVVDTSVLIDGRVADIAASGFLYGTLIVPRFVLMELQHIADSSDAMRRNRGRRGLEILARIQKDPATPVEIVEDVFPQASEVDAKLVALAARRGRAILTNDFNLNRVAEVQGIRVLNVNSLANAMKAAVLPGEELHVTVIQEGKEAGQGVAFLDDGTMVVVEGGTRFMGRDIDVHITRVLQTVAGRMIFAQPRVE